MSISSSSSVGHLDTRDHGQSDSDYNDAVVPALGQKSQQMFLAECVSVPLRKIQDVLSYLRPHFRSLSIQEFKTFFSSQEGQELDPEELGYTTIEELLEHLHYERKINFVEDISGIVRISTEIEDSSIVTTETLEHRKEDLLRVGSCGVYRISQLESVNDITLSSLAQMAQKEELRKSMTSFYEAAPLFYQVYDRAHCLTGRLLAVRYQDKGVFRVVVKKFYLEKELVLVQHIDYGTIERVKIKDLFFLDRRFLAWPVLATKVRLWAVRTVAGRKVEEMVRLKELLSEESNLGPGLEVAVQTVTVPEGGERHSRPSVLLTNLLGDNQVFNFTLITSGEGEVNVSEVLEGSIVETSSTAAIRPLGQESLQHVLGRVITRLRGQKISRIHNK